MFETPGKTITLQTKKLKIMKTTMSQKLKSLLIISIIALPIITISIKAFGQTQGRKDVYIMHEGCQSCGNCIIWCDDFLVFNKYSHPVSKFTYSNEFTLYRDKWITDINDAVDYCPSQSILTSW